ncbi:MAG TPA: cytochrome c [Janthinobacterium sp.]|nr:cytochrome c [Janthinobacterium sp.]
MKKILSIPAMLLVAGAVAVVALWPSDDIGPPASAVAALSQADKLARGAYLATAGDCMACHTVRGGAAYAGGLALATPFGKLYTPNITSDKQAGIGAWSADDFWRALHNGKSRDGRLLYPGFPYTNYSKIRRDDADALYAYFQTVPASPQASRPHALRFPYNQQIALALWRALYFRPAVWREQTGQSVEWNRGAYLVQGLGHCSACHSSRNPLGAEENALSGGLIPIQGWYAPSLTSDAEAGLGDWDTQHLVALLKTGVSPRATVFGPMAAVVRRSLQQLSDGDVKAIAVYLKSLPAEAKAGADTGAGTGEAAAQPSAQFQAQLAAGARLYESHCVDCHQANGKGIPPAYPPLAGNRALTTRNAANAIRIVLNGGFAPGTGGNPRPYGMPPFGPVLSDAEVAALVTYLRNNWGNQAPAVAAYDVNRYRSVPLD